MEIYHFLNGQAPARLDHIEQLPAEGFVWIDFVREQSADWEQYPRTLLGLDVDAEHIADSQNPQHPSSFDCTDAYDVLIMEGLGPDAGPIPLTTRVAAFFLFDRLLISVHADDGLSFRITKERLLSKRVKLQSSPLHLAHCILDALVDRFLDLREPLDRELTRLQDELLDSHNDVSDWRELLNARREARRLESLSEAQLEALDAWRRNTRFDWSTAETVRIRDLYEHVTRVLNFASGLERDLEAAVDLHFAAVSNRSNEIMKVFTVMSVVFMPLTLLTGIWGMNFEDMPELHWRYGYPVALGLLAFLGVVMLLWFRRRKFF
jgi:magnesium/cobalt transport protein CorA